MVLKVGLGLTDQDVVYMDLLSNQVYLGTDEYGNSIEPEEKHGAEWSKRRNKEERICGR